MALSWASFLVIMAHGLVAAADCRMAWENRPLEPGDSRWKATLADPADSEIAPKLELEDLKTSAYV